MFEVIFEVHPSTQHFSTYLSIAGGLKPTLESQHGFIANVRYRSLTRPGWLLSLSDWADEKSLVRWRSEGGHHQAQERGRGGVLTDYHLRVGEAVMDVQAGDSLDGKQGPLPQQRFDETETGEAKVVGLINTAMNPLKRSDGGEAPTRDVQGVLETLKFDPDSAVGLISWDAFEAILTPGDVLLLCSWRDLEAAERYDKKSPNVKRIRHVRIIRDYGMFDRVEAPQYYPDVEPVKGE